MNYTSANRTTRETVERSFFSFLYIDIIYPRGPQFSRLIDCLYVDHAALYTPLSLIRSLIFAHLSPRCEARVYAQFQSAAAMGVATVPMQQRERGAISQRLNPRRGICKQRSRVAKSSADTPMSHSRTIAQTSRRTRGAQRCTTRGTQSGGTKMKGRTNGRIDGPTDEPTNAAKKGQLVSRRHGGHRAVRTMSGV